MCVNYVYVCSYLIYVMLQNKIWNTYKKKNMMKNLMVLTTLERCIPAATDDDAGLEDGEEFKDAKLLTIVLRF